MLFSTKSRYGVRAMYVLVKNYAENCPISIKNISAKQGISEQYLEQIFSLLKKAGLIRSIRGQKGGYILSKDPKDISMGQMIRALEGPLAPVECVEDSDCCEIVESCCAISIWTSIYNDINNVVDSYSLADMVGKKVIIDKGDTGMESLYFDHAATTYVKKEVLDAMMPYYSEKFGNCSSIHSKGREAKKALDEARNTIASYLGAKSDEIYFTSGGSESDNWAIKGVAFANMDKGKHIITTGIEHHAVINSCEYLKKFGFEITYLSVDEDGLISIEELKDAIREDTILISIMYANNEIGTILPIEEAADVACEKDILFHTDAVQYVGQGRLDLSNSNIDLLSFSGHKLYAPNGVGGLYIKQGVQIDNLVHGGAQERGRRAGTDNLVNIVGMAKAFELAYEGLEDEQKRLTAMRDRLIDTVLSKHDNVILNGHRMKRLANNVNFSIKDIDGEAIMINLDLAGIACSTGSACTSSCTGPSFVLGAIGLEHRWANGSVRLTMGQRTKDEDIDKVIETIDATLKRLDRITF